MPLHDWTRVEAYAYHDFRIGWLVAIRRVLNDGALPPGYYARAEQTLRTMGPDVLTLQSKEPDTTRPGGTVLTVPAAPPRVAIAATGAPRVPAFAQKRLAIRHSSDDRLVAIVELVSPGNTSSAQPLREFVKKVVTAVDAGIHALVIDPFPPGKRDPNGLHGVIWPRLGGAPYTRPDDKPLALAAYESGDAAGSPHRCYVQPLAVGDPLPDMPLFLRPDEYVYAPLERAYQAAYADVLPQDRAKLEPR
ncbi:hypothetical protein GobsT_04250 [Gemmata obscuriglobus]|uniref:DUF4058 domain-containing protein n=1 Tax=Gemmata obscuriglobus TaxID=114 RepID=A0A2Z3HGQ7_9BACT|nr:DUF4058 family protein [Gemmata obscuriglobus]AWM40984.1 DUF4058 domain-containing protein [Gemmata obscuriglobus]QEG25698.1 hypothetical protein GobsT_04250 [Gemmata obscuriglobus]VTR99372.1 Uncharacterized protein OS=Candidatus Entotheonella sp. TSY2 GN=ETSY2_30415 PE=4 SV=1: DUF4058 [Gemmata obscuriglobus UQM 2246]